MVELAADQGFEHVTVRQLTQKAGVSSRTFYRHFANREQCLASSAESVGRAFLSRAARSTSGQPDWESQVKAILRSLFGDFAGRPRATQVVLVEALVAGRPGRRQAREATADLERLFARLFAADPSSAAASRSLVIGTVAGVIRVATATTLTGRAAQLPGLASKLSDWVLAVHDESEAVLSGAVGQRKGEVAGRRESSPLPDSLGVIDGYGQSDRILSAVMRLAADEGFAELTVSKVRRQAGVSRQDFNSQFDDVADCFLAAVESLAHAAAVRADSWAGDTGKSGNRIYRTMLAISALAARNQTLARLVLDEILAPGRRGLLLREQLISEAAHRLLGRPVIPRSQGVIAAEASVAAVWRITQREISDGRASGLPRSAPFLALLVDLARRDRKHRIQKFD